MTKNRFLILPVLLALAATFAAGVLTGRRYGDGSSAAPPPRPAIAPPRHVSVSTAGPASAPKSAGPAVARNGAAPTVPAASVPRSPIPGSFRDGAELLAWAVKNLEDPVVGRMGESLLQDYLSKDPAARARELLGLFARETDPAALELLVRALGGVPEAAGLPDVAADFVKRAGEDPEPARRLAAVGFLAGLRPVPGVTEILAGVARTDAAPGVRLNALSALGRHGAEEASLAPRVQSALLEAARGDPDPSVRAFALQTFRARGAEGSTLDGVADVLRTDADPEVRRAAAAALGAAGPDARGRLLPALERAFGGESQEPVRRVLLASIVRTGREASPDILRRLSAADPSIREDAEDYLEILKSGSTDWEDILREKLARERARGRTGAEGYEGEDEGILPH